MLLSDAILKGAAQRPQCSGRFFEAIDDRLLFSCALGAAYEGVYGAPNADSAAVVKDMDLAFPGLLGSTLEVEIVLRNDEWRWTREQIAAWLKEQGQ